MSLKVRGAKTEGRNNFKAEQENRDSAPRILGPDQVGGKEWKAAKLLETTLGLLPGEKARNITKQDLKAFKQNIKAVKLKAEKGIKAADVIRFSTEVDKKRSRQQIKTAIPYNMKGGVIRFITDSGPESKVAKHHVHVILSGFESGLSVGTPLQAAKAMAKGNLKFDCDCEHHTYVFRYITTVMGANAGRAETGFPKIRNPYLTGVACKHVLRVMVELDTSRFIWKKISAMVNADRKKNADKTRSKLQKTISLTQKEANELAKKQAKKRRSLASKKYKASSKDRDEIEKEMKKAKKHIKVKRTAKRPPNAMEAFNKVVKENDVSPEAAAKIRAILIDEMQEK